MWKNFILIGILLITMCANKQAENGNKKNQSNGMDIGKLSEMQKRIEQMPNGKFPLSEYLQNIRENDVLSKSKFTISVFGRTGPLFPDDGKLEPKRIETELELPFVIDGQHARIVMQLLVDERCEQRKDVDQVTGLNRILMNIDQKPDSCHNLIVWQSKLLK